MSLQQHQDRQELDAINEDIRIMVAALVKSEAGLASGDQSYKVLVNGYKLRINRARCRANTLAERLWPANVRYMEGTK